MLEADLEIPVEVDEDDDEDLETASRTGVLIPLEFTYVNQ